MLSSREERLSGRGMEQEEEHGVEPYKQTTWQSLPDMLSTNTLLP